MIYLLVMYFMRLGDPLPSPPPQPPTMELNALPGRLVKIEDEKTDAEDECETPDISADNDLPIKRKRDISHISQKGRIQVKKRTAPSYKRRGNRNW